MQTQGRGAADSRDPGPANGPLRWIQRVRIFCHVCIVFISPPGVELRVLSLYSACFLRVFCVFCVVYFLRSATATLTVRMCFPRVWRGIGAVQPVCSLNNTKHAKYMHKTRRHC